MVPLGVAGCAVAASLPGALGHALYGDEVASARIVVEPDLADVLGHVRLTESTPPAWYVAAWLGHFVLADVRWLRLLSVGCAAGAAALTTVWARRLLGSVWPAALAGTLVALGSEPAAYAEQLRAYALVVLVSVGFGILLLETAQRPRRSAFAGLAATAWLGLLTHYFFFFVLAAGLIWLWATRLVGRRAATLALGLALAGFLPWLPAFAHQQAHGRYRWIGPFDPAAVARLPGALFFGPDGVGFGLARIALTVALVAGAVALWWRRSEANVVVALALLPLAGAAALWAAVDPIFDQRNMLPVAPFVAIVAAAGVAELPPRLAPVAALAGVAAALVGAAYTQATLGRTPYDAVAGALTGLGWSASEPLVVTPGIGNQVTSAAAWYLPGRPLLLWVPSLRRCRVRFAIVELRNSRSRPRGAGASRELASYDQPILGRPSGRLVVVRFLRPTLVRGAFFHVRGQPARCRYRALSG